MQHALGDGPIQRRDRNEDELVDALCTLRDAAAELGDLGLDGRLDRPVALGANGAALRVLLGGWCVSQGSTSG
jgi:hypothetical protein